MVVGETDPQLTLKTTPPRIPRTMLERARLSSLRPEFADKSVILLQTATGSGKTSLLAQWRKEALQTGAVVVWLTLDTQDNNNRFVRGLTAGMRLASGRKNFGQASLRAAETDQGTLEGITMWLAEVAELATDTLLILDDVHALPESTLNSSLVYLVLNAPANLKIILASRRPIALPIYELPARGSFVALTASDLRFDLSETVALLNARFGRRIDPDSAARLHEQTEGWPLGVQLAVSTIERSPDLQAAIARLSAQSSEIQRYYIESLVDQLPPALTQFLVSICIVDAVSPALCEAISGTTEGALWLAQVRDQTPIFSQGVDSVWLRIHPLAREFLLERFARLPESEQREYLTRAGHWLVANNLCEEGARHLLKAGLEGPAFELIERSLHDLIIKGLVAQVIDWVERLPRCEIARRPSLRIVCGWILAQSERQGEAAAIVEPILNDPAADPAERCESAHICATAAMFGDDFATLARIASSWQSELPIENPMLRFVNLNQAALVTLYRGAPEQARYCYSNFPWEAEAVGRYTMGWRDWIIGFTHVWEGQVARAVEKLRIPLAQAEAEAGRRSPIAVMLSSLLATALLDCGEVEEAAALLADRLYILERRTPPDAIMQGFLTAIRIAVAHREEQRAFDLLDHLYALGEARALPRLCIVSLGERIRMHALRGRGDISAVVERKLDATLERFGEHLSGPLEPVIKLQVGLARAYAAVAAQDWARAQRYLNDIWADAEGLRRGREVLQIYLLRALARKRTGEDGTPALQEALSMARLWGFTRIVGDTHPDLVDWARQLQGTADATDSATAQPEAPPAKPREATGFRATGSSLLSPKEREVLQLLAGNLSNKQIALAMGVSDETIKWHLRNLFGKLNAGGRKHLIDRARMLGLLAAAA